MTIGLESGCQRRQFSRQAKTEAAKLATGRGVSVARACRDLELPESVPRRWMHGSKAAPELGSPSTGKLVGRLEERGLVERVRDPQDRRSDLMTVTEAARRRLKDLEPVGEDLREDVLQNLMLQEREHLSKMLVRIKERLARTEGSPSG